MRYERRAKGSTRRANLVGGELFVVEGDLFRLACDAVLIPTDRRFRITRAFATFPGLRESIPHDISWGGETVVNVRSAGNGPDLWLGWVGTYLDDAPGAGIDRIASVAESFVRRAGSAISRDNDRIPLVALPFIGSASGGGSRFKGELLRELMTRLALVADASDVDVAFVAWEAKAYAAAQAFRTANATRHLSDDLFDRARVIADEVQRDNAVLFIGAGVSMDVGAPSWTELLRQVAVGNRVDGLDFEQVVSQLDLRDVAWLISRDYANPEAFRSAITNAVVRDRFSLTHSLLASLGVRESVTTNYDTLFESAAPPTREPLRRLPGSAISRGDRWLLKLHGSLDSSTVITRGDYLDHWVRSSHLFGVVQAMLMTRHMLFVGYSMRDEDFHQVIHEVRAARPEGVVGTALVLCEDPVQQSLWRDVVEFVPMVRRVEAERLGSAADRVASRRLRVFLDAVGQLASTDHPYALDPSYAGLDQNPSSVFSTLASIDPSRLASKGPDREVRDLLRRLGHPYFDPDFSNSDREYLA